MATSVTAQELQTALQSLAEQLGVQIKDFVGSEKEVMKQYIDGINGVLNGRIDSVKKELTDLITSEDVDIEKLQASLSALQKVIDENGGVDNLIKQIEDNAKLVVDESERAKSSEAELQKQIDERKVEVGNLGNSLEELKNTLNNAKATYDEAMKKIIDRVSVLEKSVETLNGDETVVGSVANLVAEETKRAKASETEIVEGYTKAIADVKTGLETEIAGAKKDLEEKIANIKIPAVDEIQEDVKNIKATLNDTTDENGNIEKGLITRVAEVETGIANTKVDFAKQIAEVEEKVTSQIAEVSFKSADLDMSAIVNAFKKGLGLDTETKADNGDAL